MATGAIGAGELISLLMVGISILSYLKPTATMHDEIPLKRNYILDLLRGEFVMFVFDCGHDDDFGYKALQGFTNCDRAKFSRTTVESNKISCSKKRNGAA